MSNNTTPQLKELARRILLYETNPGSSGGAKNPAVFRVCNKLCGPLGRATGVGGYRSLLSRALTLADAEVPGLRALQIKADGSLEGAADLKVKLYPHTVNDAEVILVSQVLGLLVTFIGPALTQQLLLDIWPKMSGDINDDNGLLEPKLACRRKSGLPVFVRRTATPAMARPWSSTARATQSVPA